MAAKKQHQEKQTLTARLATCKRNSIDFVGMVQIGSWATPHNFLSQKEFKNELLDNTLPSAAFLEWPTLDNDNRRQERVEMAPQSVVVSESSTKHQPCHQVGDEISFPSLPKFKSTSALIQKNNVMQGYTNMQPEDVEREKLFTRQKKGKSLQGSKSRKTRMAVSVMMSTDFVVSAPVRENLLLTLAFQKQRMVTEEEIEVNGISSEKVKGKVLLGIFTARSPFTKFELSHHAVRVAVEPNAGGASVVSEALSVEYFVRRFKATNVVTEMEVEYYQENWKKVDYICDMYGQRFGVSVTRAMAFPNPELFNKDKAVGLLRKKLYGLVVARSGIRKRHSFEKAILHVWCETEAAAQLMQSEFHNVASENDVVDHVIMVLTVAEGPQGKPIFYESKCREHTVNIVKKDAKNARASHPFSWLRVKPFL